jgi:hypothetical protein
MGREAASSQLVLKERSDRLMVDIRMRRQRPDRSKINMGDKDDIRYWSKHLGVSTDKLAGTVDKVGNSAVAVRKELRVDSR